MSERRCPNCGGLVGADAEWCTQCFARLDEPEAKSPQQESPTPSATPGSEAAGEVVAPAASGEFVHLGPQSGMGAGFHAKGESIVWDCPMCGTENPLEATSCSACGTPFGQVFEEPERGPEVDPGRAATFSLFFPGAGHYVAGRKGEAFARGTIFAFSLVMGLISLGPVRAGSGGIYLMLMVVSLTAAAALYMTSTADAGRAARGEKQILSMRMLLYGAVGLIFISVVLLTLAATQARG